MARMLSVRGSFSEVRSQPYVTADIKIERLGMSATIEFLVDTGADYTAVHWGDRQLLTTAAGETLPGDAAFASNDMASGIAGQAVRYGIEEAVLIFRTEEGEDLAVSMPVRIAMDRIGGIPSLLGRDFLSGVRLDFNMPADDLVIMWS